MKTRKLLSILIAFIMVLGIVPFTALPSLAAEADEEQEAVATNEPVTITNGDYSLTVNKTVFDVGEPIYVTASGPNSKDWVGFYQWDQNGSLFWQYVDGMGDGKEVNFIAGKNVSAGEYVIRLQANDSSKFSDSKATVKIKVGDAERGIRGDSSRFYIEKFAYEVGEPIMVKAPKINDDSWIGLYQFEQYGKISTAWHWIDNPNAGGNEKCSGADTLFDVTQGKELTPGVYIIHLFPNGPSDFSSVIATAVITVVGDTAASYESFTVTEPESPEGGEPDVPVDPNPDPEPEPDEPVDPNPDPDPEPDPDVPVDPNPDEDEDDGITFEESGSGVKVVNGDYELCVNKTVFDVGEPILVSGKGLYENDWIGIYRVEDSVSIKYQYLGNVGHGIWYDMTENYIEGGFYSKYSSLPEGEYVIRLQAKGGDYFDSARALVRIKIGNPKTGVNGDSSLLSVDKLTYKPGEPIMVTPHLVGNYTDSWVGIYSFDNYVKGASNQWEWVNTNGDGVAYDVTEGKTLDEGIYLIRLLPYDTGDMTTAVSYVMVTVGDKAAASYDSIVTDENTCTPPTLGVTTSNSTHSMSVNKTRFEVGEEIWVTATGVHGRDWIGIAQRGTREATVRWYYITDAGNGVPYDIRTAPNVGGNLGSLASLPEGLYTIYLVEKDQYLKNDFTFSINIAIGNVDDNENGKSEGGTSGEPSVPSVTHAPSSATYTPSVSGFAGGTVSVTMPYGISGGYDIVMYWANEDGVLEGYTSLAKFKVTSETTSFTFGENTVVPNGATRLLVYAKKSGDSPLSEGFVTVDLPSGADMDSLGTPDLSMVVISDIHISGLNDTSAVNFQNMLRDVAHQYPSGVAIYIVGDMADNGRADQYANMMTLHAGVMSELGKDGAKYPLYLAIGNHDYPSANGAFLEYATLPDGTHPTDTSYDFWLDGYHYIFLGSDTPSGLGAYFTPETLAWLDSKLGEDRSESRPTFVFLHQSLYNTVSGSLPGEGWHGVTNDSELRAILAKYPEIMLFNGHSHWTMDSVGNMYGATEELPIHAFNCASVSYLWSGYNKVSGEHLDGSQGYIVEIYGNKIFVRGRDFSTREWVAGAQYLVQLKECAHEYEITDIEYSSGYLSSGIVTKKCANCGDEMIADAPALIVFKGYSIAEYDTSSMVASYSINYEWLTAYEELKDTKIELGVVACASDNLVNQDNKPINSDGTTAEVTRGHVVSSKVDSTYSIVSVIMRTDSWEKYQDLDVIMCLYLIENETVWYASSEVLTECAVPTTYNQVLSKQGGEE